MIKKYWLLKSEPGTWSWQDQSKVKKDMWDGVRNYQARNNLMQMKKGDLCFFYHSVNERQIVAPFIDAVVERLLKCAAFRDWRVTALREYMPGVDPDNYCETERTTKAVIRRK